MTWISHRLDRRGMAHGSLNGVGPMSSCRPVNEDDTVICVIVF
jgi:hypothetical protein